MTQEMEIKRQIRTERNLDSLERRRDRINSSRNSRGELQFKVEDIFAELMMKFN